MLNAAKGITEIITQRGIINRDFNDVDTTLREGGTAIISSGYGEGEHRVTKAIADALHSPLLKDTDIIGSKKMLMILYIPDNPEQPFSMSETNELTDFVSSIDDEVDVMWGLYRDSNLDNKVKITILASGFDVSIDTNKQKNPVRPTPIDSIDDVYGAGRTSTLEKGTAKIISPDQLDDEGTMAGLESEAAADRRGHFNPTDNTASSAAPRSTDNNSSSKSINFDDLL